MLEKNCACSEAPTLIFSCSGGSDVGELTDKSARKMSREKLGKMYCLAGVGGHAEGILKTTGTAAKILMIDGCPVDCGRKILEHAGFAEFAHIRLTDMGMEKGKSPATEERIDAVFEKGKILLET